MVAVAWRRWRGWERREAGASRYPPGGCPVGCPSPGRGPLAPTPSPPSLPSPPPRAGAAALEGRSRLSPNQHGLRDLKALNLPFGGRLECGSPPNSHQKRRTSLIAFTGPCYPLFRDSSHRTRSPSRRFPPTRRLGAREERAALCPHGQPPPRPSVPAARAPAADATAGLAPGAAPAVRGLGGCPGEGGHRRREENPQPPGPPLESRCYSLQRE